MNLNILNNFEQALIEGEKSPRTVAGYVGDMQLFARWFHETNGEELAPANLTSTDVKQYRSWLQITQKAAPKTINHRLAALRSYGAIAVSQRLIEHNPAEGIHGVKEQELAPKWLDKKEQAKLVREVERRCQAARSSPARLKAIRDRAIVVLLLNTGLRVGELVDLEMSDIVMSERKGELTVRLGKGGKSRRIPLNANARKALQDWYALRPGGSAQVFPMRRRMVQHMLGELGEAAKVEGMTAHRLRHSFAKNLVDMGVSLEKVAMLLGHSNLETTRIYTVPGMADLQEAVGLLED